MCNKNKELFSKLCCWIGAFALFASVIMSIIFGVGLMKTKVELSDAQHQITDLQEQVSAQDKKITNRDQKIGDLESNLYVVTNERDHHQRTLEKAEEEINALRNAIPANITATSADGTESQSRLIHIHDDLPPEMIYLDFLPATLTFELPSNVARFMINGEFYEIGESGTISITCHEASGYYSLDIAAWECTECPTHSTLSIILYIPGGAA